MSKPYIEVYENEARNAVLVYVPKVSIGELIEPEWIAIQSDHVDEVIKQLKQFKKESE
tara:strand:+ start:420 stop:593 length:174 start_codon:yes stop_codon:yes gene_type:complete